MLNADDIRAELLDSYRDYCTDVSEPGMAMSLQTGTFLLWLCRARQPVTVADYGSGWSSYVLRLYAQQSGATVTSVDTDPDWLQATCEFLAAQQMPTDGLMLWEDYRHTHTVHDLIFHDLANGVMREATMHDAVERCIPGGVVIFDDAHHESHHNAARQVCGRYGMRLVDMDDVTKDGMGRFCAAAEKP